MMLKDRTIAGFLPRRSAILPMIRPPSGRVRKPTPNVASDKSNLLEASPRNTDGHIRSSHLQAPLFVSIAKRNELPNVRCAEGEEPQCT